MKKAKKQTYNFVVTVTYRGKRGGKQAIYAALSATLEDSDGRRNIEDYLAADDRIDAEELQDAEVTIKVRGKR